MGSVTLPVRSVVWFVTGVVLSAVMVFMFLDAWQASAAPGDEDSTFVPINPCRLADTRPGDNRVGTAGTLGADSTTVFQARGTNGRCVIPGDAVALSLNVTALGATTPGTFVTVWPGGPLPTASSLNPAPGQPPIPNAVVTPLAGDGSFRAYNFVGAVNIIIDVNGYYTQTSLRQLDMALAPSGGTDQAVLDRLDALEAANTALEAEIVALKTKTASMSAVTAGGQPTVRFSGVNVQVVDGTGDTDGATNGRGNLIVGYNRDFTGSRIRTGSHNLVVGDEHAYSSYAGTVLGSVNSVTAPYASVTGGSFNTASDIAASVSGGSSNSASGLRASVSGGSFNTASGDWASVSGGSDNTASNFYASVSGGNSNTANSPSASVSGGMENRASGFNSSVSGGRNCTLTGLNQWGVGSTSATAGCPVNN